MPASWQAPDLDEARPNLFVVNNAKVRPFLRGEGELSGKMFQLHTWRREGWIARIRLAGFNVRTLRDRVDVLPRISPDVIPGPELDRPLASARERIGTWDEQQLRWRDLPIQTAGGRRTVRLRLNQAIRRRKSRGEGDYFIVGGSDPEHTQLRPIGETNALMHAYSMSAALGRSPRIVARTAEGSFFLPFSLGVLPEPHRKALEYLALPDLAPWTFAAGQMPLVAEVFARLGLPFEVVEDPTPGHTQRGYPPARGGEPI